MEPDLPAHSFILMIRVLLTLRDGAADTDAISTVTTTVTANVTVTATATATATVNTNVSAKRSYHRIRD